jgi:hypothetical protein
MTGQDRRTPADLAAELIAADRPSTPVEDDEPPPIVAAAMGLGALLAHPFLRRHRRALLPWILLGIVVALLIVVLGKL